METSFSVTVRDQYFRFQTGAGVFSKGHLDSGTRLLAESMTLPESGQILDLACGYGPLGIIAAKLEPKLEVILTDSNANALKLAKTNAVLNQVENIEFRLGSIYHPVEPLRFNLIVTNPPLAAGSSIVSEIIRQAPLHLQFFGALELVVRKGLNMYRRECEKAFGSVKVLARGSGYRVFHARLTKT